MKAIRGSYEDKCPRCYVKKDIALTFYEEEVFKNHEYTCECGNKRTLRVPRPLVKEEQKAKPVGKFAVHVKEAD